MRADASVYAVAVRSRRTFLPASPAHPPLQDDASRRHPSIPVERPPLRLSSRSLSRTTIIILSYNGPQISRSRVAKNHPITEQRLLEEPTCGGLQRYCSCSAFRPWTSSSRRPAAQQHRHLHPHRHYRGTNLRSVHSARFLNNQKDAKAFANDQTKIHLVTKRDSRRAKTCTRRVWRGIRGNETSPWPYHYSCQYRELAFLLDGYSHSQGNR